MFKFNPPLVALTVGLALASFTASAQMSDRVKEHPAAIKSPDAVAVTRDMMNRLHLNEGQYLKLLPVNRTLLSGMSGIKRQYKNDETTRAAKEAELEAQYEQECSRILTPIQLSQLQQDKGQPATTPATSGSGMGQ